MAGSEGVKATVAALFANLGIAVAKFVAFAVTASASMLAESIHSVADASNQALLLLGRRRAARPATPEHPFGYGRERYFWAFVVAIVLFTSGSVFSLYEGVSKYRDPHELSSPAWAIGVLLVALVLETASIAVAIREANHVKRGASWWAFIRRSKVPELPVVLLEDLGALFGLVFALGGVIAATVTNDARFDAVGSFAIGVLLGVIAVVIAIEMKSLLIGESASPEDLRLIERVVASDPDVRELLHLKSQHIGPDELLLGVKVLLTPGIELGSAIAAINRLEASVRSAVPQARVIYVEPDVAATPVA